MKKILFGLFVLALISGCEQADKRANEGTAGTASAEAQNNSATITSNNENPDTDPANLTSIEWLDTKEKDMGKITEGQKLEVSFRFKNTGTKPLLISKVWAQCGCTIPETPKEPYAPGQEGVIKASFDSQGRGGTLNTKEVYVNANTDPVTNVLVFTVDVKKKG
ncbi:MAG TPA: DUF1573 domain-containing protein [Chitinophagaceae bacterium]|nr:DUF1573 domain-containing protein [Chitinophagaceae bacterium]